MFPIAGFGAAAPTGFPTMPGLQSSSSATGQTGSQSQSGGFTGQGVNFGTSSNQLLLFAGLALVGYLLWKRK